ncbi:MAG: hypothetical protein ACFNX7_06385 [Capnocytophaga gingivalis]
MKKIMASLVAIAALVGCSKSDDNGGGISISEGTFPKKIVNKFGSGSLISETTYNLQGGKILSSSYTSYGLGGSVESKILRSISYEGDYPKEVTYTKSRSNGEKENFTETHSFVDGKLKTTTRKYGTAHRATTTTYSYHSDGKLAKVLVESPGYAGQNGQTEEITFVRETDYTHTGNVISAAEKKYTKDAQGNKRDGDTSLKTYTYTFENENLIKKTEITTNHEYTTEYTYDGKNNPYLQNSSKLVKPDYFISTEGSKNNVLTRKETRKDNNDSPYVSEHVYEYTYADNNYPLTQKIFYKKTENGVEKKDLLQIFEYTY